MAVKIVIAILVLIVIVYILRDQNKMSADGNLHEKVLDSFDDGYDYDDQD